MQETPPNQVRNISNLTSYESSSGYVKPRNFLQTPEIQLHCPNNNCNGLRFFRCTTPPQQQKAIESSFTFLYVKYRCSNCQGSEKTYSLAARVNELGELDGQMFKFGEFPAFGPPTPPKLMKLIGPDRSDFLKGRRCENQGLGVGAFIYYRRVVESQKNRILQEIIKVSEKLSAPKERLDILRNAISEVQFSKALDMAKDVLPESLLINGHSPIKLLHSALSEGVHAMSDEECMKLATCVRIVLGELSDRLGQALKDEAELSAALSTLLNRTKAN